jgi:integrase
VAAAHRLPVSAATNDSFEAAVAAFCELHVARRLRPSSRRAVEYALNTLAMPVWRGRKVADISRADVRALIEDVAVGTPYAANRLKTVLSKLFNWLVARDVLPVSPVTGVEQPHREVARQRVLDDGELAALWRACEDEGPYGVAAKLMVLTGARRTEVAEMRWAELDEQHRLWKLPAERCKNNRPHVIPLVPSAWSVLEGLPRIEGCEYVLTTDGRRPISAWSKAKRRLSAKAGIAPESWRLHDLRRTAASGMQRLGVAVPVVEKALNHASGVFRGIVGVYQTHDYADEVRIALQRWADHIERIVGGEPAKVVRLR